MAPAHAPGRRRPRRRRLRPPRLSLLSQAEPRRSRRSRPAFSSAKNARSTQSTRRTRRRRARHHSPAAKFYSSSAITFRRGRRRTRCRREGGTATGTGAAFAFAFGGGLSPSCDDDDGAAADRGVSALPDGDGDFGGGPRSDRTAGAAVFEDHELAVRNGVAPRRRRQGPRPGPHVVRARVHRRGRPLLGAVAGRRRSGPSG
mmetsp:Transcript_33535/g.107142  ORF Transcript_33535/g.107142 Transcript_33535/m.107142 type:complete len:202 (+) Transcript_33535:413-1018(+)